MLSMLLLPVPSNSIHCVTVAIRYNVMCIKMFTYTCDKLTFLMIASNRWAFQFSEKVAQILSIHSYTYFSSVAIVLVRH